MADTHAAPDWPLLPPPSAAIAERVAESPRADPRLLSRGPRILERGSDPPPHAADADAAAAISRVASAALASSPATSICTPRSRSAVTAGPVRSASLRRIPVAGAASPPSAVTDRSLTSPGAIRGLPGSASAPRTGGTAPPFVGASVERAVDPVLRAKARGEDAAPTPEAMKPAISPRAVWLGAPCAPRLSSADRRTEPLTLRAGDGAPAIRGMSEAPRTVAWEEAMSLEAAGGSAMHSPPPTRPPQQLAPATQISSASASTGAACGEVRRRAGRHRRSLSCPSHESIAAGTPLPLPAGARMPRCAASSTNLALIASNAAVPPAATNHGLPWPNRHRALPAASGGSFSVGSPPWESPPRVAAATAVPGNRRASTRPSGVASSPSACSSPVFTSFTASASAATPASPVACPATPSGLPPRSRKPAASYGSPYPLASPQPVPLGEHTMFARDDERLRATSPTPLRIDAALQGTVGQAMAGSQWARLESPQVAAAVGRQGAFSPTALSRDVASPLQSDSIPSPQSVPVLSLPSEAGRAGKASRSVPTAGFLSNFSSSQFPLEPLAGEDGSDSDDDFVGLYHTVARRRAVVSAAHLVGAAAGSTRAARTQGPSAAASGGGSPGVGGLGRGGSGGPGRQVQEERRSRRSMSADFNFPSWAMEMYDSAKGSRAAERRDAQEGVVARERCMQQGPGSGSSDSTPSSSRSSSGWSSMSSGGDSRYGSNRSICTPSSSSSSIYSAVLESEYSEDAVTHLGMSDGHGPLQGMHAGLAARAETHGRAMVGRRLSASKKSVKFNQDVEWI
ncbi:hypothetical protein CLOP_g7559 [Closterium sp. NIES-67]|nr:hypothetical protein CLOP_g7559 [Closterium sp. NIES-67]